MRRILLISLVGLLVFPLGCSLIPLGGDDDIKIENIDPMDLTPRENEEAELMALWLSGELVAPTALYDSVLTELALIRSQWADSLAFWDDSIGADWLPFYESARDNGVTSSPPWYPGELRIRTGDSLGRIIRDSTTADFTDLLEAFHVQEWSLDSSRPDRWHGDFKSGKRLNPEAMSQQFNKVFGEYFTQPRYGFNPESNIYRHAENGRIYYFWIHGWRWMDPGNSHFFFFEVVGDSVPLVDTYYYRWDRDPMPSWPDWIEITIKYSGQWRGPVMD